MRLLAVILGLVLVAVVAQDAFETIVLPRRVTRRLRLARLFYRATYQVWRSLGRLFRSRSQQDAFFGYMGPLSLLALVVFWALLFVLGFGLVLWGLAVPLNTPESAVSLLTY